MTEERLNDWAARRGYRIAFAGTPILREVREKLERRRNSGAIDGRFFRRNLGGISFVDEFVLRTPRLLVMVAVPRPVHVLSLAVGGKTLRGLIPPTYVHYRKTFSAVLADMRANALGPDLSAEVLKAPLKSTAVHMGLVAYGRNNITYVPGRGSGHQLCGYVIDAPPPAATAGPGGTRAEAAEVSLERCASCRACLEVCPTGAIRPDRFLISAERCFTYFSESRKGFPKGTPRPRRPCLVGCMDCQEACPENKGKLEYEPLEFEFSEAETGALMAMGARRTSRKPGGVEPSLSQDEARVCEKLGSLGLTEDIEHLGRNLAFWCGV